MKNLFTFIVLLLASFNLIANSLYTVDNPTAAMLGRGEASVYSKLYQNDGISIGADVGLTNFFQMGLAFGAEHVLGNQNPKWSRVDYKVKLRLINETQSRPALAIGVDTQGHGTYHKDAKRYEIKSKGAYAVLSKNYELFGLIGFDFGSNYSFEDNQDDAHHFDVFLGFYKTASDYITLYADFACGLNDLDKDYEYGGLRRGYLNTAIQFNINEQFSIKLLLHDLLRNRKQTELFDRSLLLDYRWFF